jgi:hypothetical protein
MTVLCVHAKVGTIHGKEEPAEKARLRRTGKGSVCAFRTPSELDGDSKCDIQWTFAKRGVARPRLRVPIPPRRRAD